MWKEFKTFVNKGNAFDLAIGVVIGASFSKIVDSLVKDIINPIVGIGLGRVDLAKLYLPLTNQPITTLDQARTDGIPVIAYGAFINTIIEFFIVAFSIFIVIRQINRLRGHHDETAAKP